MTLKETVNFRRTQMNVIMNNFISPKLDQE